MSAAIWIALGGFVLTAIGGIFGALLVPWRLRGWLGDQFDATRKMFNDTMKSHEDKDQERHEENLERFARIRIALAKAGINPNGENGIAQDRH
jgi:hypothetical protein